MHNADNILKEVENIRTIVDEHNEAMNKIYADSQARSERSYTDYKKKLAIENKRLKMQYYFIIGSLIVLYTSYFVWKAVAS